MLYYKAHLEFKPTIHWRELSH